MVTVRPDFHFETFRHCIMYKCNQARQALGLSIKGKTRVPVRCLDAVTNEPSVRMRTILFVATKEELIGPVSLTPMPPQQPPSFGSSPQANASQPVMPTFARYPESPASSSSSECSCEYQQSGYMCDRASTIEVSSDESRSASFLL
jgi:hypothetical protein